MSFGEMSNKEGEHTYIFCTQHHQNVALNKHRTGCFASGNGETHMAPCFAKKTRETACHPAILHLQKCAYTEPLALTPAACVSPVWLAKYHVISPLASAKWPPCVTPMHVSLACMAKRYFFHLKTQACPLCYRFAISLYITLVFLAYYFICSSTPPLSLFVHLNSVV